MIATDMIDYIESDLSIFGIAVTTLLVLVMWLFFRRKRWVFLPMLTCGIAVWMMVGVRGYRWVVPGPYEQLPSKTRSMSDGEMWSWTFPRVSSPSVWL